MKPCQTSQQNNRTRKNFGEAFQDFEAEPVFGAERLSTFSRQEAAQLNKLGIKQLQKVLTPEEQDIFADRIQELFNAK